MRPLLAATRPSLWLLSLTVALSGCAQSTVLLRDQNWRRMPGAVRVVVMPPDVQLSELTAGGLLEPKADWTESARRHVAAALEQQLHAKGTTVLPYEAPASGGADEAADIQLIKLHDAVGGAIIVHKYVPALALPTKADRFDWTLGTGVRQLQERTGADELMLTTNLYGHADRIRSYELVAEAAGP